jgi:cytochrome c-type biogenesis protein CcmH
MRQEISFKLAAGQDLESIKADFVTQYGPQILGEPPRQGFNWLAWLLPVAVMLAGAIFLVVRGRSLFVSSAAGRTAASPPATIQEDERLARQLDEELKRYG